MPRTDAGIVEDVLSNRRRAQAWLTLVAFLCTFVLPMARAEHVTAADDTACATASTAARGGDGDRLDASAEGAATEHCPLCHFQRAAGGAAATDRTRIAAPAGRSVRVSVPPAIAGAHAGQAQSSRAPPTLL